MGPAGLDLLELTGLMVGKALYDGVLLETAFAPFFVSKLLGQYNYLEDLPSLDPQLYRSLIHLKRYEGDARDLCLDFTISDEVFGEVKTPLNTLVPPLGGANSRIPALT